MTKTRTERRLEKRQTVVLLALVLVVSLASFVLGVMVGKRGGERDLARKQEVRQETVRVVQTPVAPVTPEPKTETLVPVPPDTTETAVESARLSFYDDLVRDAAPLGSGINQPPRVVAAETAETKPPQPPADQPVLVTTATVAAVTVAEPASRVSQGEGGIASTIPQLPPISPQGTHAVQIGSFSSATDAASFRKVMLDKGYPAYLSEADLGARGIWYRVRIGPYQDSEVAGIARKILQDQEKIEGLVTRNTP